MTKWADKIEEIRAMVRRGMTDDAIGVLYQVTGVAIYQLRRRHGIPAARRPGDRAETTVAPEPVIEPELVYEENGVRVKRYPARYAETSSWGKVVR